MWILPTKLASNASHALSSLLRRFVAKAKDVHQRLVPGEGAPHQKRKRESGQSWLLLSRLTKKHYTIEAIWVLHEILEVLNPHNFLPRFSRLLRTRAESFYGLQRYFTVKMPPMTFNDLPKDIVLCIRDYLTRNSSACLSLCSHAMQDTLEVNLAIRMHLPGNLSYSCFLRLLESHYEGYFFCNRCVTLHPSTLQLQFAP